MGGRDKWVLDGFLLSSLKYRDDKKITKIGAIECDY